jgi:hypothetical protein
MSWPQQNFGVEGGQPSYMNQPNPYMNNPSSYGYDNNAGYGNTGFENEPPLLEELGINMTHIRKKTMAVLNPFREVDQESLEDNDLSGPLFFALLLGTFLLMVSQIELIVKKNHNDALFFNVLNMLIDYT